MKKIPVYLMPGLGAGKKIFEHLKLPDNYQVHYMYWIVPYKNENLQDYIKRIMEQIKDDNPILIGYSFGGIIVQEISKQISVRQVIIIASIKHHSEISPYYKFARKTKIYKLLPVFLLKKLDVLAKLPLPKSVKSKIKLYQKFLEIDNLYYIRWAINQMYKWRQDRIPENLIHISGEKDRVFPAKFIKNPDAVVPNGSHEMIVIRVKWFNENLPRFLTK